MYKIDINIAFSFEGKDYIGKKGDTMELPDCDYVKTLEAKKLITPIIGITKTKKK